MSYKIQDYKPTLNVDPPSRSIPKRLKPEWFLSSRYLDRIDNLNPTGSHRVIEFKVGDDDMILDITGAQLDAFDFDVDCPIPITLRKPSDVKWVRGAKVKEVQTPSEYEHFVKNGPQIHTAVNVLSLIKAMKSV